MPACRKDAVVPHILIPNAKLRLLDSDHELLNVLDVIWQETGPFLLG